MDRGGGGGDGLSFGSLAIEGTSTRRRFWSEGVQKNSLDSRRRRPTVRKKNSLDSRRWCRPASRRQPWSSSHPGLLWRDGGRTLVAFQQYQMMQFQISFGLVDRPDCFTPFHGTCAYVRDRASVSRPLRDPCIFWLLTDCGSHSLSS